MLKAELHIHTNADPEDKSFVSYSAYELIDQAEKLNFNVLAITCHNYVYNDSEAVEYAKKKGILLISGAELTIEGKHVLVYNITNGQAGKIKSLSDLKKFKENHPEIFIIAPHPFHYKSICLMNKVVQHLDLFDAWEYSFFYLNILNPNKRTLKLAKKYNKPMVGGSDVHKLKDFGRTYTLIDSSLNIEDVFKAIKLGETKIVTKPLSYFEFVKILFGFVIFGLFKKIKIFFNK
jgi:predicted metal-dependent phosphoesterase TrpH